VKLKVVGAGLGRTGTHSLKIALEQLLGGPCYHMIEVFGHPEHVAVWQAAADGGVVDWSTFPEADGYVASVDWPGCSFWREMADANPDAIILLSTRTSAEAWWKSASDTIFQMMDGSQDLPPDWTAMVGSIMTNRFTPDVQSKDAAIAAYERHNAEVRANADPARLVEWTAGDGWEPICKALGVAVPDDPFPHVNTTEEFRAMAGLDGET
jgi:hypothetical protein